MATTSTLSRTGEQENGYVIIRRRRPDRLNYFVQVSARHYLKAEQTTCANW